MTTISVTVQDPDSGRRYKCARYPRFGFRCMACGRGWVSEYRGAHCSHCGAEVVEVIREENPGED